MPFDMLDIVNGTFADTECKAVARRCATSRAFNTQCNQAAYWYTSGTLFGFPMPYQETRTLDVQRKAFQSECEASIFTHRFGSPTGNRDDDAQCHFEAIVIAEYCARIGDDNDGVQKIINMFYKVFPNGVPMKFTQASKTPLRQLKSLLGGSHTKARRTLYEEGNPKPYPTREFLQLAKRLVVFFKLKDSGSMSLFDFFHKESRFFLVTSGCIKVVWMRQDRLESYAQIDVDWTGVIRFRKHNLYYAPESIIKQIVLGHENVTPEDWQRTKNAFTLMSNAQLDTHGIVRIE